MAGQALAQALAQLGKQGGFARAFGADDGAAPVERFEAGKEFGDYADEGGLVILNDVPPGFYTLVASAEGFRDAKRDVEVSKEISSFLIKLARDD